MDLSSLYEQKAMETRPAILVVEKEMCMWEDNVLNEYISSIFVSLISLFVEYIAYIIK